MKFDLKTLISTFSGVVGEPQVEQEERKSEDGNSYTRECYLFQTESTKCAIYATEAPEVVLLKAHIGLPKWLHSPMSGLTLVNMLNFDNPVSRSYLMLGKGEVVMEVVLPSNVETQDVKELVHIFISEVQEATAKIKGAGVMAEKVGVSPLFMPTEDAEVLMKMFQEAGSELLQKLIKGTGLDVIFGAEQSKPEVKAGDGPNMPPVPDVKQ